MNKPKNILITGATSGVGYETAVRLLQDGHVVQVTGRNEQALEELRKLGASIIQLDLVDEGAVNHLLKQIQIPDICIFSAGVGTFSLAQHTSDEETDRMFTVNVLTPIEITQRILPHWLERKNGHFIFLGSQAGKVATPKAAVYAATKHAIAGYTDALRMEVSSYNINVTVIHPGPIDTGFLDRADRTGNYRGAVSKQLLSATEVAESVVSAVYYPKREINLPRFMGVTSKLHALAPGLTERLGKRFFFKKMQ